MRAPVGKQGHHFLSAPAPRYEDLDVSRNLLSRCAEAYAKICGWTWRVRTHAWETRR